MTAEVTPELYSMINKYCHKYGTTALDALVHQRIRVAFCEKENN